MLVPTTYWYELRSVRIEDSVVGVPPLIGVERYVRRDFTGTYSVRLMTFPDNDLVCVAGPFAPIPYRKTDAQIKGKDLAWWLRDSDAFESCRNQGLRAGQFVVVTNHTILHPWRFIPWVSQVETGDVASNVFTIFPTEIPPVDQLMGQQIQIEEIQRQLNSDMRLAPEPDEDE